VINKSAILHFRCSPTEKKAIEKFAAKCGLAVSDYLRILALKGMRIEISLYEKSKPHQD